MVTNIFDNINSNKYTGLIFLDLTKAFDTVDHNILFSKLAHYGIRGLANNLIRSFLNRKQYVYINEKTSTLLIKSFGVPQGSILGPLLFLLYINDLPSSVSCTPRLFADDTGLALSDKNLTSLSSQINNDLDNISGWFRATLLTVNPSKPHALIIPPKLNKPFPAIEISINNSPISLRNNVKYLEVTIDSSLKFNINISTIAHKTSRAVGIISKLRHYMPTNALLKIYYSLIHSQLLYGLPVWGSTYTSYLNKLITIQNKAVKASFIRQPLSFLLEI